jgi:hypothetical protein
MNESSNEGHFLRPHTHMTNEERKVIISFPYGVSGKKNRSMAEETITQFPEWAIEVLRNV